MDVLHARAPADRVLGVSGERRRLRTRWEATRTRPRRPPRGDRGHRSFDTHGELIPLSDTRSAWGPAIAGIASNGLNNWASTFHTVFLTWPDSFEAVATSDEDAGVILLRPSTLE